MSQRPGKASANEAVSANSNLPAGQTSDASNLAVLLVQVDPEQRRRVAVQLTQAGFIVVTAASGADAIELCEHFAVAAVVWDVPPAPDVEVALKAMRRFQPELACCLMEDMDNLGKRRRAFVGDLVQAEQVKLRLFRALR
jgi:response regulator RpfG family c-di-GMP phosphodiesterase